MAGFLGISNPIGLGLSLLPSLFGGGGQTGMSNLYSQYQQDVAKRPDYTYLNQDPLIQNMQKQGNVAKNQAMQQAMQNLIRSGFGRSNIAQATASQAGTQAMTPYTNSMASMLSNLQNQTEQNRLQALRDVLQGRLGLQQQQNQAQSGLQLAGFTSLLNQFNPTPKFNTTTGQPLYNAMTGEKLGG
jgi:hypothetical protein